MELEPAFIANLILGVLLALGYLSRNYSASGRARRKELRRLRRVVELYAGWSHASEVHAAANGFTLPRKPELLRHLERIGDEGDEDDDYFRLPDVRGGHHDGEPRL